jgi:carbohydrate-binding DOMON domain-containing protein
LPDFAQKWPQNSGEIAPMGFHDFQFFSAMYTGMSKAYILWFRVSGSGDLQWAKYWMPHKTTFSIQHLARYILPDPKTLDHNI